MVIRKIFAENLLSAVFTDGHIVILTEKDGNVSLSLLNPNLETVSNITTLKGSNGFILNAKSEELLISIDDKLILVEYGKPKLVLRASRPENIFWHATEAKSRIFVQEYGEPPTGIYVLEDLENCERLITNTEIDRFSRHFHHVVHDHYRNWLVATMGDCRLTRVIISKDLGETWRPICRDPSQFLPIVALKDKLVFGMDSAIFRGGIGMYHPSEDSWGFIFLKWLSPEVRFAQMCELSQLSNGLWIAALGTPQAIVFSKELKTWYAVHVEGFDERFNHHMIVSEGKDFVVCSTWRSLSLFKKSELENLPQKAKPVMASYQAHIDRLKGYSFTLKRKLLRR